MSTLRKLEKKGFNERALCTYILLHALSITTESIYINESTHASMRDAHDARHCITICAERAHGEYKDQEVPTCI